MSETTAKRTKGQAANGGLPLSAADRIAGLEAEVAAARAREAAALDQQAALAEVLRIISASPRDLQRVLDAIVQSAARLCGAEDCSLWTRVEGGYICQAENPRPGAPPAVETFDTRKAGLVPAWAGAIERGRIARADDVLAEAARDREPWYRAGAKLGIRSAAAVPLFRDGEPFGALTVNRYVLRPFTDAEVALLQAFADQAVIAIENARLFNELQDRNREVTEALDRQTAMSEVLEIIGRSPTNEAAAIVEIATRAVSVCHADHANIQVLEDGHLRLVASNLGSDLSAVPEALQTNPVDMSWILNGDPIYVRDSSRAKGLVARAFGPQTGGQPNPGRSAYVVPLRREGRPLGTMTAYAAAIDGLSEADRQTLRAFADQAVIAIENARLFHELQDRNREVTEALERETATAEVLDVISRAPSDLQSALNEIVLRASTLLGSHSASIERLREDRASECVSLALRGALGAATLAAPAPVPVAGVSAERIRAFESHRAYMHHGGPDAIESELPQVAEIWRRDGVGSAVVAPLVSSDGPFGVLILQRESIEPYATAEMALVETFANQAVIAIENARLFNELQDRNREVTEALERQTAVAAVLEAISRSALDLSAVLQTLTDNAGRLLGARWATLNRRAPDGTYQLAATYGMTEEMKADLLGVPIDEQHPAFVAAATRRHVTRYLRAEDARPEQRPFIEKYGDATGLNTPLLSDDDVLGTIGVVRPGDTPFTGSEIALLRTFADQAVIAIENARLFHELQDSNASLGEALSEQTRLRGQEAELLQTVSRQAEELRDFNRQLEGRVAEGVAEVERLQLVERFVAPSLAEAVAAAGDDILQSHRREIAVLFSDLRGYTTFSSTAEPEDVMTVLNELHAAVGPLVFEHRGTITQFTGDGMMILFNDPVPCEDPAWRAVQLAIAMRARVADLTGTWTRRGHDLEMGVGVAIGYATCGRVGFEGRYEYTAIGTVVNLASRLCGVAKGGQILVSQRVQSLIADRMDAAPAGDFELKGFPRPVPAFALEA